MNASNLMLLLIMSVLTGQTSAMDREQFHALAQQCAPGVHPETLAAVIQTESAFNPLAINLNGAASLPRQPADIDEAIATAEYLDAHGYSFDAGLGQINNRNVTAFGMPWADVFEACSNLTAASEILSDCFTRASREEADLQIALRQALSCYNTGNFSSGHHNGYVARVEHSAGLVPALIPIAPSFGAIDVPPTPLPTVETTAGAFGHSRLDAFSRVSLLSQREHEWNTPDHTGTFTRIPHKTNSVGSIPASSRATKLDNREPDI